MCIAIRVWRSTVHSESALRRKLDLANAPPNSIVHGTSLLAIARLAASEPA